MSVFRPRRERGLNPIRRKQLLSPPQAVIEIEDPKFLHVNAQSQAVTAQIQPAAVLVHPFLMAKSHRTKKHFVGKIKRTLAGGHGQGAGYNGRIFVVVLKAPCPTFLSSGWVRAAATRFRAVRKRCRRASAAALLSRGGSGESSADIAMTSFNETD